MLAWSTFSCFPKACVGWLLLFPHFSNHSTFSISNFSNHSTFHLPKICIPSHSGCIVRLNYVKFRPGNIVLNIRTISIEKCAKQWMQSLSASIFRNNLEAHSSFLWWHPCIYLSSASHKKTKRSSFHNILFNRNCAAIPYTPITSPAY